MHGAHVRAPSIESSGDTPQIHLPLDLNPLHSDLPSGLQAGRLSPSIMSPSNLQGTGELVSAIMIRSETR